MKNILFTITLLVSIPNLASAEWTYEGKIEHAIGNLRHLKGGDCAVKVITNDDDTINVLLYAGGREFVEINLEPSFTGTNLYQPIYRINHKRARHKEHTVVVYVDPADHGQIISVSAYKMDNSMSGYLYDLECRAI